MLPVFQAGVVGEVTSRKALERLSVVERIDKCV